MNLSLGCMHEVHQDIRAIQALDNNKWSYTLLTPEDSPAT